MIPANPIEVTTSSLVVTNCFPSCLLASPLFLFTMVLRCAALCCAVLCHIGNSGLPTTHQFDVREHFVSKRTFLGTYQYVDELVVFQREVGGRIGMIIQHVFMCCIRMHTLFCINMPSKDTGSTIAVRQSDWARRRVIQKQGQQKLIVLDCEAYTYRNDPRHKLQSVGTYRFECDDNSRRRLCTVTGGGGTAMSYREGDVYKAALLFENVKKGDAGIISISCCSILFTFIICSRTSLIEARHLYTLFSRAQVWTENVGWQGGMALSLNLRGDVR